MSCVPGSPKTGGRRRGTPNKVSKNVQKMLDKIFRQVNAVAEIKRLLASEDEKIRLEAWRLLMSYRFGWPKEQLEVSGSVDIHDVISQARARVLSADAIYSQPPLLEAGDNGNTLEQQGNVATEPSVNTGANEPVSASIRVDEEVKQPSEARATLEGTPFRRHRVVVE